MLQARFAVLISTALALSLSLTGCHKKELAELDTLRAQAETARANLANFDDLDFNVFSAQKWDQFSKSHAADIVVHWPDGHSTTGLDRHIEDLKAMFVYAPDTRIREHSVKIASGEWTAVTGVMEGTFTEPMPIGDGRFVEPTGKAFKLKMCTVGRWKNGVMVEEYLYWDNQAFMNQIGPGEAMPWTAGDAFWDDK